MSFKPGTVSKDDVLLIAHKLGPSWKMFGRVLNVPDAEIDQIEANKSEVLEKCYCKCNCVVCLVIMGVIVSKIMRIETGCLASIMLLYR